MSEIKELEEKMKRLGIVYTDADSLSLLKDAVSAVEEINNDPSFASAILHMDGLGKRTINTSLKIDKFFESRHINDVLVRRKALESAMEVTSMHYCPENMAEEKKYEWVKQVYCTYEWTNHLTLK